MRISDWSSDVCSSDLLVVVAHDAVEEIVEADDRTVRLGLGAEVVLVEACRQVELVVDLVERVAGLAAQRAEGVGRSGERRVGKERVRTCRSRGAPYH